MNISRMYEGRTRWHYTKYRADALASRVFVRVRSGPVIRRVQEFLTTAHYGGEASALHGVL